MSGILPFSISDSSTFSGLPEVPAELAAVQALYGGRVLLDEDFNAAALEAGLIDSQPSIVHLATHALFTGDPETSFLLTHKDRITMSGLADLIGRTQFSQRRAAG